MRFFLPILALLFSCAHVSHAADEPFNDLNLFQNDEKPIVLVNNVTNKATGLSVPYGTNISDACPLKCNSYTVAVAKPDINRNDCTTLIIYSISVPLGALPLTSWDLVGVSVRPDDLIDPNNVWRYYSAGILRTTSGIKAGETKNFILKLSGAYTLRVSQLILHSLRGSCVSEVEVPALKIDCPKDCILEPSIVSDNCGTCNAVCGTSGPTAVGTQTCTKAVLQTALPGGVCNPKITRPCTKNCNVDCVLQSPPVIECSPDCASPTKTISYFYTTLTTPKFDGKTCDPNKVSIVTSCSWPSESSSVLCGKTCKVAGVTENKCIKGCSTRSPTFITSATFPITIQTPAPGLPLCPTATQTCNCLDCGLGPSPTSYEKCDAICTYYDDSFAVGYETLHFPISVAAKPGGNCVTASLRQCSIPCRCQYTSASIYECAYTSTYSATVPWVAYGQAFTSFGGGAPSCPTQVYSSCSSVLKPIDCTASNNCASCTCTQTTGPDYILQKTLTCSPTTIKSAQYGGKECTRPPSEINCSKVCPGCSYQPSICDCKYTTYSTDASSQLYGTGYKTCTMPNGRVPQAGLGLMISELNQDSCKLTSTNMLNVLCTTKVPDKSCFYVFDTLGDCIYTATRTTQLPWVALGTQLVTFTEARRNGAPASCTRTIRSRICSSTVTPIDCLATTVCYGCSVSCSAKDSGIKTGQAPCSIYTISSAADGGRQCTGASVATPTTCSDLCPAPTDTIANGLFGPADDVNLLVLGNANAASGFVGGRLAVCGTGFLLDCDLGSEIRKPVGYCETSRPVFFVGGDLTMTGNVYGGNVVIGGKANNDFYLECSMVTNTPIDGTCFKKRGIQCPQLASKISSIVATLAGLKTTGTYIVTGDYASLKFGQVGDVEVINVLGTQSNPFRAINSVENWPLTNATIVLNVFGASVAIKYFSTEWARDIADHVIWNFPEATKLEVTGMDLYGAVVAPKAELTGSGAIYGQVFVASYAGEYGNAVSVHNIVYAGSTFGY